jgi:hypothetical protein
MMTDQSRDDDLQALWQSQLRGETTMSIAQIRAMSQSLERRVARKIRHEYIAAAIAAALFGVYGWIGPTATIRVGASLVVAASLFTARQLRLRVATPPLPTDLALTAALDFYRAQLVRQRDLLRSVWWWGLLPAVPGLLVLQIGQARAHPELISGHIALGVLVIVVMVGVHVLNRRVAARIQRRLDRLSSDSSEA